MGKKLTYRLAILAALVALFWNFFAFPSRAAEGTAVEIGSASTVTGGNVRVPITFRNVTGPTGMGAYDIRIKYDPAGLRINGITPGTNPYFASGTHNINNVEGIVYLNAFHGAIPGPTGDIGVAFVEVLALAGGTWVLEPVIVTLSDTRGKNITASTSGGSISVAPKPAVELESVFMTANKSSSLAVVLKEVPQGEMPASYSIKVAFSPPMLKIAGVKGGDFPYDRTPAFAVDAGQAAVTITASRVQRSSIQGKVILAYIDILVPAEAGEVALAYNLAGPIYGRKFTAGVSILSLKGQTGSDISANAIPGILWALPQSTIEVASTRLTLGEPAAIAVQLKNIGSIRGLGSYEVEVTYNPSAISLNEVVDWPMHDRSYVEATHTISNGTIVATGAISRKPGPLGDVSLLNLKIHGTQPGQHQIGIKINILKDTAGQPFEAVARPGLVTIVGYTKLEISSASATVGTPVKLAVRLKDYHDPGGLGSSSLVITYPGRAIEVIAVEPGDVPFEKPPEQQIGGTEQVGTVGIAIATTDTPKPPADIVLAYLTVTPLAEGDFRFSFLGSNIRGSHEQPIGTARVDGTVTARTPFRVSSLAISPGQPNTGDKLTLTATVANMSTTRGTYTAQLRIGPAIVETRDIVLEANESKSVSFIITRDIPGLYRATLGQAVLDFTVADPANLKATSLMVSAVPSEDGTTVTILAGVENTGKVNGLYIARLKINGILRDSVQVSLKPGEKQNLTFYPADLPPGDYIVEIDNLTGSFSIPGPTVPSYTFLLAIFAAMEATAIALLLFRPPRVGKT